MLDRRNRLLVPIVSNFNTMQNPLFTLKISRNQGGVKRFAFVVSKRVDKRAVVRNRIKRIFRASIRNIMDKIDEDIDALIIVKKKARESSQLEIKNELEKSLLTK